jgi:hypothetical protein
MATTVFSGIRPWARYNNKQVVALFRISYD